MDNSPTSIASPNVLERIPLPSPRSLVARFPASDPARATVARARARIADVLHGRDRDSLVAIVGPCSIHDPAAALEYAERLRRVRDEIGDRVVVVMRAYLEKPRTVLGWKGLINDPRLDGSCDLAAGLALARETLLAIAELGVPCGSELLDPSTPWFVGDLLAWAAIGARTTLSQTHREMASALDVPVGFKNPPDGDPEGAFAALEASGRGHTFVSIDAEGSLVAARSRGNPDRHLVLRGGSGRANCGEVEVARAASRMAALGIARGVMIDCSHDNSGRDLARQATICRDVLARFAGGEAGLLGIQLESHLRAGRQALIAGAALEYGLSITDGCLGWDETERLLREAAAAVDRRRSRGGGIVASETTAADPLRGSAARLEEAGFGS